MYSTCFIMKLLHKKLNVVVTLKSATVTVLKLNLLVAHFSCLYGYICSVGGNPGMKLTPGTALMVSCFFCSFEYADLYFQRG